MKKKITFAFGKKNFLLGKIQKKLIWLEEATFICGCYWGLYVTTYTNNRNPEKSKNITSITTNTYLNVENIYYAFEKTTFSKEEGRKLTILFKYFYKLRNEADKHRFKNIDTYIRLNEKIKIVTEKIIELLKP